MLDQGLQHVDVALSAYPAVDPGVNGFTNKEGWIDHAGEGLGREAAGGEFLPLVVAADHHRRAVILKSSYRFMPLHPHFPELFRHP